MGPESLKPKTGRNSVMKRSEYNALVEGVQRKSSVPFGAEGGGTYATRDIVAPIPDIIGRSTELVQPYSIFGCTVDDGENNKSYPVSVAIAKIGTGDDKGSSAAFFTNVGSSIPANGSAIIRPVNQFSPARLLIDGTDPEPGKTCGPAEDSYGISLEGQGLICLSVDGDYAWCIRDIPGACVFGAADADLAAATGTTELTIDSGDVTVWAYNATDKLEATSLKITGHNEFKYKIKAGILYKWVPIAGRFFPVELASRAWEGTLGTTTGAGSSNTITLSDGTEKAAKNVMSRPLRPGTVLAVDDAYTRALMMVGATTDQDFYYGVLAANLSPSDGTASLTGVVHLQDGTVDATFTADNLYSWSGKAGDFVFLMRANMTVTGFLLIVVRPRKSRRFKGTLSANLSGSAATASVGTLTALDGSGTVSPGTVKNDLALSGKSGDFILVDEDLNGEEGIEYILDNVEHYKKSPFTSLRYNTGTHEFQFKRTDITVLHQDDEDDDWTAYHSAVSETVVTSVGMAANIVVYTPATAWLLEPVTPSTPVGVFTFSQITIVGNVFLDGIDEKQTTRTGYVWNPSATSDSLVVEGTTCDDEEGS